MSQELINARKKLSMVKSLLKQEKYQSAVQYMCDAVAVVIKNPLMKTEKEEFMRLIGDSVFHLDSDAGFRQVVPLSLEYLPGHEKDLLSTLREILAVLDKSALAEAEGRLKELEALRARELEAGAKLIGDNQPEEAAERFNALLKYFPEDHELMAEMGELFLKAGHYEHAYTYLSQALEASPESIHLYNRIGMALRKLGRFETAEKYYSKALEYVSDDPNLYFNIGRLYIDWRKWDKVAVMAHKALKHNPDFLEAKKMLSFAEKRMDQE